MVAIYSQNGLIENKWLAYYASQDWTAIEDPAQRCSLFLNGAYLVLRGSSRDYSMAEMARDIGISTPLLSQWTGKHPKVPTKPENIKKLVNYFGPIIYIILGLTPPQQDLFMDLPPRFQNLAHQLKERMAEYKVDGNSPEADRLAIEIMIQDLQTEISNSNSESAKK